MARHAAPSGPAFERLKQALIRETGLAYYRDKEQTLLAAIAERMHATGSKDCEAYYALLSRRGVREQEIPRLVGAITIGETYFFRYPEQFEALRTVILPDCLHRNQHRRSLRIWSAACSNGAEPYSLSILLQREFSEQLRGWSVSIVGSDINRSYLEQATKGAYGDWALRGMTDPMKTACFEDLGPEKRLRAEFRQDVQFLYHNLAAGHLPNYNQGLCAFDIVLCRNVMIYFDGETRRRLLQELHDCLLDGGWLLVGHAEVGPDVSALFTPVVVPGATVYKKAAAAESPVTVRQESPAERPGTLAPTIAPPPPSLTARAAPQSKAPARPPQPSAAPIPAIEPPADPEAEVLALADSGDLGAALDLCCDFNEQYPVLPGPYLLRGLLEQQMGCGDEVESLRRAVYLDKDFALAHYHLALAYWRRGRMGEAKRHFRTAGELVAVQPAETLLPNGRGLSAGELKRLVEMWLNGG